MELNNIQKELIPALVQQQRDFYISGKTRNLKYRKEMLERFEKGLRKWEKPLCDALWADLHKSYQEAYLTELGLIYGEIKEAKRHLKKWSSNRKVWSSLACMPGRSEIVREPMGCSLIIAPWNYPVQLLLNPLVGAIAAGCTAILKPSPYVPNVSKTLTAFVQETFPQEYVSIVEGDRSVNAALLEQQYDVVFFTGSPALGRTVMAKQSAYLTRLILELGGKSPCIVDKDANLRIAARRIAWGKSLNAGQTCIAPDYLFVHQEVKEAFIKAFKEELKALYPDGTKDSAYYVHLVRDEAFERVKSYLKDGTVVAGGDFDAEKRWMEPTLLDDVSPDSDVMTQEIFGPVFPIMTFKETAEVVSFIQSRPKPLAFYYFGKESKGRELIACTSSGGACINDVIMHIASNKMPFGGVGNSGMGSYHGERSFLAFSHERALLISPTWIDLNFRYMPYKLFKYVKNLL